MDNMVLCCLLVEGSGTKPSIVNNVLSGGSQESQVRKILNLYYTFVLIKRHLAT